LEKWYERLAVAFKFATLAALFYFLTVSGLSVFLSLLTVMTAIDQILRQAMNPFDPATFKPGNFWHDDQDPSLDVESIHQEAIAEIGALLAQVAHDHRTRTLLLYGDSGAGKSHLLGRLKRLLSDRAFFVYVDPFPESDAIWRHVLRYTVDSLLQTAAGQTDSQLLRWLKSLAAVDSGTVTHWQQTDRQALIHRLKTRYPSDIYNATEFFGVLYDVLHPERYFLACEWLRGDDLDEESLEKLSVQQAIDSEDAAQKILANFGRIAIETQPIVICFDQLDNIARSPDGVIDLQAIFDVNSSIRNQGLKNFLVVISIITNTWKLNGDRVQAADRARIDSYIPLKPITLTEAEALWQSRLAPLHRHATPAPQTPIYPLTFQALEQKFPGGKTLPRNALELGRRLLQSYKTGSAKVGSRPGEQVEDAIASFKLVWLKEFKRSQSRITRMRQFSAPELIQMLKEIFMALQVGELYPRFLPSPTYASQSFSYEPHRKQERIGIAWNDDPNMTTFYHVMNACRRAVDVGLCRQLMLIRAEGIGKPGRKGYEIFMELFTGKPHTHIHPDLTSVHQIATYHSLVNAAYSGELVVAGATVDIHQLEELLRESEILKECQLLQDLGVLTRRRAKRSAGFSPASASAETLQPVEEFLLDLAKTHRLLGRPIMVQTALSQFEQVTEDQVNRLIATLCKRKQLQILDPSAKPEEQLVGVHAEADV
jgi:energy-coupling factor transporter ATP-binding protein EcfA2